MSRSSDFQPDLEIPESLSSPDHPSSSSSSQPLPRPHSSNPASPKPHLFGGDATSAPAGVVRPSDLLTPDDYKRLRWNTSLRGVYGGVIGGVATTFFVRQFWKWPTRPTPKTLTLTFLLSAMAGTYTASSSYLLSEIAKVRKQAEDLSLRPQADHIPSFEAVPVSESSDGLDGGRQRYADEGDKWSGLRSGGTEQMRDPFLRPGVPRRDV